MSASSVVPTLLPDERPDILSLLDAAARPLADVVADFLARFPRERRLRDKMMLHPTGRLIAFAILHQSYSPQTANPYIPILLNVSGKPCQFCDFVYDGRINIFSI
ncbi:hypothetical protein ZEAMMB73_Zm00001d041789 [Zea mays]|uniref:Uncharacterized protein n=1 Tax=Zea mays TaxID=4577 RepID=A0A1D6MY85_MAIZE|nr:hypothetical protein ZEAMMB73_Zm00001d041789 [Zea mays]